MTRPPPPTGRYSQRLLALIAFVLGVAALRASYPVIMPILFAGVIVAALWPLKLWFDRRLPSWFSYVLTIVALVAILFAFAAAVTVSIGQVLGVLSGQWDKIQGLYDAAGHRLGRLNVPLNPAADKQRIFAFAGALASGVYSLVTYVGFIGLLVFPRPSRGAADAGEDARRDGRAGA